MVTSQFPPLWGGVGIVAYGQVVNLAARGHEVHVITREHSPDMVVPQIEGDVHIHHVPMLRLPMFFTTSFAKHAVKKMMQMGNDFDVVHVHSNMALMKRRHYTDLASPVVSTMHGTWKGERSEITWRDVTASFASLNDLAVLYISPLFDKYEDIALELSNAALIICDNELRADRERGVSNIYGDDRWIRLSAGFDTEGYNPDKTDPGVLEKYGIDPARPTVLFVGRLAARKGIFDMIEIFGRAHAEFPDSQLVVLGSGPQEKAFKKRVRQMGLEAAVHMTGSVPFPDLQAMYATCDVVLFPSFWEGQGLIIGEALASGTPIIAADMGWVPEVIRQGENGFHFPVRDVKTGADQLKTVLGDDDLRRRMGEQGRRDIVDKHQWSHHVDRLEGIYKMVMGDGD
jgi:glycosyltransferase involved in cell wall biosynthesis